MFKPSEFILYNGYSYKLLSYKLEPELFICIAQYQPTYTGINYPLSVVTKHFSI